jgi:hypothetical protein
VLGLIAAGLLVACGTSHRATLRISGEGDIGPVLSRADVRSPHAIVDPSGHPVVQLELTTSGQRKFLALATGLAQAGRRRHHSLHILISVNGKVISHPYIDYKTFANGHPAFKGILVDVASIRTAHDLAARLNR